MGHKQVWTTVAAAAVLALTSVPAHAASTTITTTCTDGEYTGKFVLRYDTLAGLHSVLDGRGGAGPYIGDSGTMRVRVSYRQGLAERVVFDKTRDGLEAGFDHPVDFPAGTRVPADGTASVRVWFSAGEFGCTAERRIR